MASINESKTVKTTDQTTERDSDTETRYIRQVGSKAGRKLKAKRDRKRHVWQGLGMMGIVGWSIAVPVLLGLALGGWLDSLSAGGHLWTLNLLIVGLLLGCVNVYLWINKEQREINDDKEHEHD